MTIDDTAPLQISRRVSLALTITAQHHPEWLAEKYREIDWAGDRVAAAFIVRLTDELAQSADLPDLLVKLERYLKALFAPPFLEQAAYKKLRQDIQQILEPPAAEPPPVATTAQMNGAIAVLLLDAENMHLTPQAEQALQSACQYPVRIKVAFANWRSPSLSKRDAELHQRGYQMIHVPAGKNSADIQMTAIGASIFTHHPTVREVLVCSSDKDLGNLSHSLQFHGLTVYRVHKHDNNLTVVNLTQQEKIILPLKNNSQPTINQEISSFKTTIDVDQSNLNVDDQATPKRKIQSPKELEQELIKMLQELTAQLPGSYISISVLASQFRQNHDQSVSELLKTWKAGARYITFLQSCKSFKLKQNSTLWQVALP